jgi:RNA polymerase sigma-70 factor (ECF subfamily)
MASEDDALLARYRNAEFAAFDQFYRRNHELIFRFLVARLRNRADAEEAFQETFLRVHRAIMSYDPSQQALPWVFTIARNVALDALKRARRRPVEPGAVEVMETPELAARPTAESSLLAGDELMRLTAHLTEDERSLLRQRFVDDDDFETIAARVGTSEAGARQRVSRLVRKLRLRA